MSLTARSRSSAALRLPALLAEGVSYNHHAKVAFHQAARAALKALVAELQLPAASYTIRVNPGGIAVSGEVTLHHDRVYIQVAQPLCGGDAVLYRDVTSQRDFTGGRNRYASAAALVDAAGFAARLRHEGLLP